MRVSILTRFVALAAFAALAGPATADPRPLEAQVVWSGAARVYIAAADSLGLAPGDSLTFVHRRKNVATAVVAEVPARDLAAARITSGSLARVKLDRVRILASRPALRPMPLLRVGVPGRGRSSLLFACAEPRPRAPLAGLGLRHPPSGTAADPGAAPAYRTDSLAENAWRFVRTGALAAPWPDTILVRLFGVIADEEIALERGDLDLAVFWPGEASSRLRADPRWRDLVHGSRSGGVLAAAATGSGTGDPPPSLSPDHPALEALNAELFRGDLVPWRAAPPAPPAPSATLPPAPAPATALRFEVDPACPGKIAIERFLGRATPATAGREAAATVRLFWSDAISTPAGAVPLFTMRCAIAVTPELKTYVRAIGPDPLADLIECAAARVSP